MSKILTSMFATFFFLVGLQNTKAQTFTGNITLNTQTDVDAFNFTEVDGIIFINSLFTGSITNLNGLSELIKCKSLLISTNPNLTSIIGLANLTEVEESLSFNRNSSLTNLDGLSSLTKVGGVTTGGLRIEDNESLLDIDGLFSLTFARELIIKDNPSLTNIDGLSSFTAVAFGDIVIENNDALTDLDGLSSYGNLINGSLRIIGNAELTNIDGLGDLDQTEHDVEIRNNAKLTSVGLSDLSYLVFGTLSIVGNSSLTTLAGLTSIDDVGNLSIGANSSLTDLDGISGLSTVRGGITIFGNNVLTNINGLSGIQSLSLFFSLSISNNPALANLDGLSTIGGIGDNLTIKDNDVITNLNGLAKLEFLGQNIDISGNALLTDFCGLTKLFNVGTIGGTISIINNGANTVLITAPADIILNNDPGLCSRDISAVVPTVATVTGCLKPSPPSSSAYPPGNIFPVGTTNIIWTVTDGAGNTATAAQKVIITDNEVPAFTQFPADAIVQCAADVSAANITSVTATDNCPNVVVTHVGDIVTNQTCANRYTLTRTYKATDGSENTATRAQVITVNDNVPPQIVGLTMSKQMLAPPNHKMQDITVNYNVIDNCNSSPNYTFNITSDEPVNGTGDGDTDPDWEMIDDHYIRLRAERAATGDGRIYTITITANDGCNASVTSTAQVVIAHNITGPRSGNSFKVGSTVAFSGEFWDIPANKHTGKWLIDGNTTAKATVTEPSGARNGKVTGSYKFTSPGVYKLQMNVTDQEGVTTYANTNGDLEAIVVIYDPNGGYSYGGGYYDSPSGALCADPSATGKASYGFAMNYFKNSTYPKGETQFEFKVGDFEFNALNFDYLVISNSMAQFKGTGKIIGGQSGIGFTMTVADGQLDGSGVDKIRMKIFNKNSGAIIYDNQPGASDAALPVQAVGTNSIVVINGANSAVTSANTSQQGEMEAKAPEASNGLDIIAFPNPSANNFAINVKASSTKEKITMQVVDMYGRVIETRNVSANSMIRFGERYRPGSYFVRISQGKKHKEIKLIKLSD